MNARPKRLKVPIYGRYSIINVCIIRFVVRCYLEIISFAVLMFSYLLLGYIFSCYLEIMTFAMLLFTLMTWVESDHNSGICGQYKSE